MDTTILNSRYDLIVNMGYLNPDAKRAYDREWRRRKRAEKKAKTEAGAEDKPFIYPIYPLIHGIDTPNNLNIYTVYTRFMKEKDNTKKSNKSVTDMEAGLV